MLGLAATILPMALPAPVVAAEAAEAGGAVAPTPTTPRVVPDETPPAFLISDAQAENARMLVDGTLPDPLPSEPDDLATRIVDIAEMSDALLFSEVATGTNLASPPCARTSRGVARAADGLVSEMLSGKSQTGKHEFSRRLLSVPGGDIFRDRIVGRTNHSTRIRNCEQAGTGLVNEGQFPDFGGIREVLRPKNDHVSLAPTKLRIKEVKP